MNFRIRWTVNGVLQEGIYIKKGHLGTLECGGNIVRFTKETTKLMDGLLEMACYDTEFDAKKPQTVSGNDIESKFYVYNPRQQITN